MQLTVHYAKRYDCTSEAYGREYDSTEHIGSGSIAWDGEGDIVAAIRQAEQAFLNADHPKKAPFSWNHRNYRIEVTGLTVGGPGGLALALASKVVIMAKEAVVS